MALTVGKQKVEPLFSTGSAVRTAKAAEHEALHLRHIRRSIARLRRREEKHRGLAQDGGLEQDGNVDSESPSEDSEKRSDLHTRRLRGKEV